MPDDVVLVVVTYNSADVIGELLATLPPALGGATARVVIVDNGSTDGTPDLVDSLPVQDPPITLIRSTNRGYSAAINLGAATGPATGSILVLNPDVRLRPGAVPAMMKALLVSGTGIVAPLILDPRGGRVDSLRRTPSLARASGLGFTKSASFSEYLTDDHDYTVAHRVSWATGAVLLVSRSCHDALDGWDESYFLYSEETDFCIRAADAGWATLFEPDAVAEHIGGGSGRNDRTHVMQILNRVRFYARRHPGPKAVAYYLLTVTSEISWVLRGHTESRASVRALLRPRTRPAELNCADALIPK